MKKKVLLTLVLLLIIILALIGTHSSFTKDTLAVDNTSATEPETYAASSASLAPGEPDPNTYDYYLSGDFEAFEVNSVQEIPANGDYQIYCTRFGVAADVLDWQLTKAQAEALIGKTYTSYCKHAAEPYAGLRSTTFFTVADHGTLTPAEAYVISDLPLKQFSLEKQEAIWALSNQYNGGSRLYQEALDYQTFDEQVRSGNGLNPQDSTDMNEFELNSNQNTNTYTAGPFKINYTQATYGDVTFGGISDIRLVGYNSQGEIVDDDMEILDFIMDGEEVEFQYFEPDSSLKVDRGDQVYPKSGEEFQITFRDPNADFEGSYSDRIVSISLVVDFKYMMANGERVDLDGWKYTITYYHEHYGEHNHYDDYGNLLFRDYSCTTTGIYPPNEKQPIMSADAIRSIYEQQLEIRIGEVYSEMSLGGHVWEDALTGKESLADGISSTTGDIPLKNIKVTLYTEDGSIAQLYSDPNEAGISEEELMCRINPTYTDENGNYLFKGLDPSRKYYVVFEYNGQRYLPTEYLNTASRQYNSAEQMINAGLYNTNEWNVSSKATEANTTVVPGVEITRTDFDNRFREIGAYTDNYPSSNSLNRVGNSNSVYTQLELMGYTLNENGRYTQTGTQLVDGYLYNELGLETNTYAEGEISRRVRDYIRQNKRFPDDAAMRNIYAAIAGNDSETWRKLQFIEDTNIQAYSGSPFTQEIDLYPGFDNFYINDNGADYSSGGDAQNGNYDTSSGTALYPGQYYINLGLWRRQEFDTSLRKDVYKAALKINDKTVVYNYDKRAAEGSGANNANGQDNNTYWDINVRMSDYNSYYGTDYNREIYESDYTYSSAALNHPGSDLEVYVTYKITIRNQSMSIMSHIEEIVDYYDSDYTYKPNLSWIMYQTSSNRNTSVDEDDYYNMMQQSQDVIDNESTGAATFIDNAHDVNANEGNSKYNNEKNLGSQYQNLYIRGLENKKLATGETAYIYLTFEVNKDSNGRIILDSDSSPKENLAEINGYSTFYRDGTELPNGVQKDSNDIAGLLDRDSNPGNLVASDLTGDRYEKNFEDDTDRAPSLRLLIDSDGARIANGTVWEDERTETIGDPDASQDAIIGDGIRQDDEIGISGVTVQLVEKCIDGSEYIWQETTTDENGRYNITNYIPGDYVIRFYYGDTAATAIPSEGQSVSYNGHDFKSTTYQDGIDQSGNTDISGKYTAYTNTETQNESETYGYDISKADNAGVNYSDAKDIWSTSNREGLNIIGPVNSARLVQGREAVRSYSTGDITNHKAEVLASPYERPTYNGTEYTDAEMNALYEELMNETYMTAETGVIVAEVEYNKQRADGVNDDGYSLNNVDLGLTEIPKAQLEVDKSISNIKVTLANNSILFDINEAANNAIWQDHEEYSIDRNKVDADNDRVGNNNYYQSGDAIGMYEEYYTNENRHRYSYREEIDNIVTRTDKGLVQLTMDEELMHGATIQITYTVKVTNVGEVDYVDGNSKNFYYKGDTTGAHISTTSANQVVDYVQNNLQFAANNETNSNDGWQVKPASEIISEGLVNNRLTDNLAQFNNIIQTESFAEDLLPGQEISKTLILSQLITPENTDDDLTYSNMVELVKTSNEVGRRMAYSVVGNQDPLLDDASEVDSSSAERIIILPPFGEARIYYAIGAIVAVMLIGGIILIRRKVLKNKKQ